MKKNLTLIIAFMATVISAASCAERLEPEKNDNSLEIVFVEDTTSKKNNGSANADTPKAETSDEPYLRLEIPGAQWNERDKAWEMPWTSVSIWDDPNPSARVTIPYVVYLHMPGEPARCIEMPDAPYGTISTTIGWISATGGGNGDDDRDGMIDAGKDFVMMWADRNNDTGVFTLTYHSLVHKDSKGNELTAKATVICPENPINW